MRVGRDGRRRRALTRIPVAVEDALQANDGPYFLARRAKGRYAVTTQCDAWSFPVTIDRARRRVVVIEGKIGRRS